VVDGTVAIEEVKGWLIVVMRYEEEEEEIWYCRERGEFWR
jgi:hypothetical protein